METLLVKAAEQIGGLGALGSLLLLAGAVIVFLFKHSQTIQQARLDDYKTQAADYKALATQMAKIIEQNSVETKMTSEVMRQVLAATQQYAQQYSQQSQIVLSEVRNALSEVRPRR